MLRKNWYTFTLFMFFLFTTVSCFDSVKPQKQAVSTNTAKFLPLKTKAIKGSDFAKHLMKLNTDQKEQEIYKNIVNGNVPNHLRYFRSVKVSAKLKNGKTSVGTLYVLSDYLSVGTNSDFIRTPMMPGTAKKISEALGCVLPTTKMVDEIYKQARVKLSPSPMKPGPKMTSIDYYIDHNRTVNSQIASRINSGLIAGHKKDIVVSNKLLQKKNRVAIYGWHRTNGKAIQPLSTVHGNRYVDYSHGVRLVWGYMDVDGKKRKVSDVLADPMYAPLISYEGAIKQGNNLLVKQEGDDLNVLVEEVL